MAGRITDKSGKKSVKKGGARRTAAGAPDSAAAAAGVQVERLKADCAALRAKLRHAQQKIDDLEQRRAEALNRVDWAIDSLHNILENNN